ncbi:MAG: hypothetical protein WCL07_03930 [bacterium]
MRSTLCRGFLSFIILFALTKPCYSALSLTIANPQIESNLITIDASLSATTSNYYLQGIIRVSDSIKYFGETMGSQGTYLDYVSSPDKDYISTNFISTNVQNASWSGQLKMRYKVDDPLYLGPGTYELKLRRFTGASSNSAGESNTLIINLPLLLPTPIPSPSPVPTPSPSPSLLPSPSPSISNSPNPSVKSVAPSPSPSPAILLQQAAIVQGVATISASTTPSPPTSHETQLAVNNTRLKVVLGVGAGFVSICSAAYLYLRKKTFTSIIIE